MDLLTLAQEAGLERAAKVKEIIEGELRSDNNKLSRK